MPGQSAMQLSIVSGPSHFLSPQHFARRVSVHAFTPSTVCACARAVRYRAARRPLPIIVNRQEEALTTQLSPLDSTPLMATLGGSWDPPLWTCLCLASFWGASLVG
jgi:hypothetical protein